MSKRFKSLIFISALILLGSLFIATLVDNVFEISWVNMQTLVNVITLISSTLTLSIAIILYRRFSSSQLIVDKQTEKVVELLTFINTLRFYYKVTKNGSEVGTYFNFQITDYKKRRKDLISGDGDDYRSYTNYATPELIDAIYHLSEQAHDPYIPKAIADRIEKKFHIGVASSVKKSDIAKSYFLVSVQGAFKKTKVVSIDDSSSLYEDFFNKINNTDFIYEDWMYELEVVYQRCYKWLETNNQTVFSSLNIKPIHKFNKKEDIY